MCHAKKESLVGLLTHEDLDVLIDAVEAWESSGALGEFVGDMVGAFAGPKGGPERDDWMRKREAERAARQAAKAGEKRLRKERSILLRAKLIALRDSVEAEAFARGAAQ